MLKSRILGTVALAAASILVVGGTGCDGPDLVPTAPPGIDHHEFLPQPKVDDSQLPQALGEQGKSNQAVSVPILPDLEPAPPTAPGETKTTKSGVKYETLTQGKGEVVKAGQKIKILYTGKLEDGKVFDSTSKPGKTPEPAAFTIGVGTLIKGWDEAVPGMKVGEIRKLIVPPNAGYGAQGQPPKIPANAPLTFEIQMVEATGP